MVSRIDNSYHKGEIVWAKVKGCSWWPGQIQYQICNNKRNSDTINEKKYRINFIGHNSYSNVPISKIKKFEEKLKEFSNTSKSSLIKSIEIAKNLFENSKNSILLENNIKNQKDDDETISNESNLDDLIYDKINREKKDSFFGKTRRNDVKVFKPTKQKKSKIDEGTNTINNSNIYTNHENINIDITFNVTNSNNNTVFNSFNSENKKTVSNKKENIDIKREDKNKNEKMNEDNEENFDNKRIKDIIDKLLRYHIEMASSSSQKYIFNILNLLNELKKEFKSISKKNIYSVAKDIISVLDSFTYHKNKEISSKSSEILPDITQMVIHEVFDFENNELIKITENINEIDINDIKKDIQILLSVHNNNKKYKNLSTKIIKNKKLHNNNINNGNVIEVDDKDFQFIYDIFLKFVDEKDETNAKKEFNLIIDDFFKNIYNKHNGLDFITANKRKQVCLKMLSLLKKILPNTNEEDIKKMIIFVEYKVRCEDPTLGKKYIKHIGSFYIKMKEIINGKE